MLLNYSTLQKLYALLGSNKIRIFLLWLLEFFPFRKNMLRLDTNNVCNIQCAMCNLRAKKVQENNIMSLERFDRLMQKLARSTRFFYLSCGFEPLLTPKFGDYLRSAKDHSVPFLSFASNGLLLNEKMITTLIETRTDEIIVSWNGFNQGDYERIMARSKYEVVRTNLLKLKEMKSTAGSNVPKLRVNMMLFKSNIESIDSIREFVEEFDVASLQFRPLQKSIAGNNPAVIAEENIENMPIEIRREKFRALRQLSNELAAKGVQIILPNDLNSMANRRPKPEKKTPDAKPVHKKPGKISPCVTPYFFQQVSFRGDLRICPSDPSGLVGNLLDDDPKEVLKNIRKFRKKARKGQCDFSCRGVAIDSFEIL